VLDDGPRASRNRLHRIPLGLDVVRDVCEARGRLLDSTLEQGERDLQVCALTVGSGLETQRTHMREVVERCAPVRGARFAANNGAHEERQGVPWRRLRHAGGGCGSTQQRFILFGGEGEEFVTCEDAGHAR
jgi:hypothetical protein